LSDHRDRKLEVPRFAEEEGLKLIELLEPTVCLALSPVFVVVLAEEIPHRSSSIQIFLTISKALRLLYFEDCVAYSGKFQGLAQSMKISRRKKRYLSQHVDTQTFGNGIGREGRLR
jgi:hypothetical protein